LNKIIFLQKIHEINCNFVASQFTFYSRGCNGQEKKPGFVGQLFRTGGANALIRTGVQFWEAQDKNGIADGFPEVCVPVPGRLTVRVKYPGFEQV